MLYTEKEKHEIERVKEVFAEHLRQSPDFDEKNRFDIEKYLNRKTEIHPGDEFIVVDADSLPSA